MSLVLNVEILGEFRNLTAAASGAKTQLSGLNKTAQSISSKMNAAFMAIGVGFSLQAIISGLENAGKAAIGDVKSMDLLALAMKNTGSATDDNVIAAEKYIAKMQLSAGVADDELRPAYAKLFLSTKDVTKANDLLAIALDTSAGTGKDLDTVAQAMAKALNGNTGALAKLVPSIKDSKTPIEDMGKAFAGAAALAANNDPFARLTVIFGDMQEKIGMALLPTLQEFSTWLATPEGQDKLQDIIDLVIGMIGKFTDIVNFVTDNKDIILGWGGAIAIVAGSIMAVNKGIEIFNGLKKIFELAGAAISLGMQKVGLSAEVADSKVRNLGLAFGWISAVVLGLSAIVALNERLGLSTNEGAAKTWATTDTGGATNFSGQTSIPNKPNTSSFTNMAPITNNTVVNVKSTQSAQDIAAVLARSNKTNGTTVFRGL